MPRRQLLPLAMAERSARSRGSRLLDNPEVQAIIEQARKEIIAKSKLTTERLIEELGKIALIKVSDVADLSSGETGKRPF